LQTREWKDANPDRAYAGRDRQRAAALEADLRREQERVDRLPVRLREYRETLRRNRRALDAQFRAE
jgi:hypothetical protein